MSKKNSTPENETTNITPVTETSKNTVILRNYPGALIRTRTSKDGVSSFTSMSFIYKGTWASAILDDGCTSPSSRRDGEIIPDHHDVNLGPADDVRIVSVKSGEDEYDRVPMFNSTIQASVNASRQAYLRSIAV